MEIQFNMSLSLLFGFTTGEIDGTQTAKTSFLPMIFTNNVHH